MWVFFVSMVCYIFAMNFLAPQVVGILNVTPDSFSDGGHFFKADDAFKRIEKLVADGADMIDIGAESTRPGSEAVDVGEELRRLEPVIMGFRQRFDSRFSVDTMKAEVAELALNYGASYINDVSALRYDARMSDVIAAYQGGVVLMHMQGVPKTMQQDPQYDDVVGDVCQFLLRQCDVAKAAGITDIILDPGFGFGKTIHHQLTLMDRLDEVTQLGYPLMLGVSRKSMIGLVTGAGVDDRLPGSLALAVLGLTKGAQFFRVHDVAETRHALDMAFAILKL